MKMVIRLECLAGCLKALEKGIGVVACVGALYASEAHLRRSQATSKTTVVLVSLEVRGRDRCCWRFFAQIPVCAANALGSCLGCGRRIACQARDASVGLVGAIGWRGGSCAPSSGGCAG